MACRQSESETGHEMSSTHDSITAEICEGFRPLTTSVGSGLDGRDRVDDVADVVVAVVVVAVVVGGDGCC